MRAVRGPKAMVAFRWITIALVACALSTAGMPSVFAQQLQLLLDDKLPGAEGSPLDPQLKIDFAPAQAKPGDEVTLRVRVDFPPESYTYSLNRSFGGATRIDLAEASGLTPIDEAFQPDRTPKTVFEPDFNQNVEKFTEPVTFSRRFRINADATANGVFVTGKVNYQVCDKKSCRPLREEFRASVQLAGAENIVASTPVSHPYRLVVTPERSSGKQEPLEFTFQLTPEQSPANETVTLSVTAKLQSEWHIFAVDQDPKMAGLPTVFKLDSISGLEPIDAAFRPASEPKVEHPLENIVQRVHYGEVIWQQKFRVTDAGAKDGFGVAGTVRYQVCREGTCLLPLTVPFALGKIAAGDVTVIPAANQPGAGEAIANDPAANMTGDVTSGGLFPFLLAAIIAGFAALLTPCVFPMIPITVSYFLKQSELEHHRPIRMALIYCAGIIATFTILGLVMAAVFGATSLNTLANNPWLNLVIAGVLVFFGMNLLGMFEIRVPAWLLTWSSNKEGQGGVAGVLFMSLTFTLVSFTCTFAFAGLLLAWAARGQYYWPILGMLAFSAAFALPFFFLALFPSFLQKLPRSGGWMNLVKVTMGMIEVGAAFKFFSVADLAWNPEPLLFDFAFVLSAWVAISICTGLYLLGVFRMPHDTPSETIGVFRLIFALAFFCFGGYLAVGLLAPEKPTGKLWEQINAFLPPRFGRSGIDNLGPYLEVDGLKFALDFEQAVQFAEKQQLPLFLDFTGVNCVNCRKMESRMAKPFNRERLERFVRVQIYQDNVPKIADQDVVDRLLEKNRTLQEHWFGDVTLPSYAVVTPEGKKILASFKGLEEEDGQFAKFLDEGLQNWERFKSSDPSRLAKR